MDVAQTIKDILLPELEAIKQESVFINKRLDSIENTLLDQSRRIDETNKRIDSIHSELSNKIDETNKRIDETNKRIDETNKRIDDIHIELSNKIDKAHNDLIIRNDKINARIDKLAYNMVRQTEYNKLEIKIEKLQTQLTELKTKVA
jgi:uncharacterized coiled-coil DUF342 family protein